MKFALFNPDGSVSAFYSDDVHKLEEMPKGVVEISDEDWLEFLQNPDTRRWDGTNVVSFTPEPRQPTAADVDAERDARTAAGLTFIGFRFQTRPADLDNIAGSSTAALGALTMGAREGDLRWHGGEQDFGWLAEDNAFIPMDAQTMWAFGRAAMAHKSAHIFAARAIKGLIPIPTDFSSDARWPSSVA